MLEIRREFSRQNKEIILLIEDFALIQGIQRDLLDAIIEVGERDGQISPGTGPHSDGGHHRLLRPAGRYRADPGESRDTLCLRPGRPVRSPAMREWPRSSAFVGRYLNAARLGRDALEAVDVTFRRRLSQMLATAAHYRERMPSRPSDTPPQGHGLYPFNQVALRRAIRARPALDNPDAFNPRAVIGEVVRNVFVEHGDPSQRCTSRTPTSARSTRPQHTERTLPSTVRDTLETLDPLDADRRATFLEFWGDAPPSPVNLSPVLHQAFDLSPLDWTRSSPARPTAPRCLTARSQPPAEQGSVPVRPSA